MTLQDKFEKIREFYEPNYREKLRTDLTQEDIEYLYDKMILFNREFARFEARRELVRQAGGPSLLRIK